jgi:mevalonate pyrophosphate decarboxylase
VNKITINDIDFKKIHPCLYKAEHNIYFLVVNDNYVSYYSQTIMILNSKITFFSNILISNDTQNYSYNNIVPRKSIRRYFKTKMESIEYVRDIMMLE